MRLQEEGRKLYGKRILILISPSQTQNSRFSVIITKKIDQHANVRNRIKRQMREIFRRHRAKFCANYDLLIIARRGVLECSYDMLEQDILNLLKRERCIDL